MRKQMVLWIGLACLISIKVMGQNKYNDWATNQLIGAVKKVEMKRKAFFSNDVYNDQTWGLTFNTDGYITELMNNAYVIRYEQANGKFTTKPAVLSSGFSQINRFQIKVDGNIRSDIGGWTQYMDGKEVGGTADDDGLFVEYTFDAAGRLTSLSNQMEYLLDINANAIDRIYYYKGQEMLPYKVMEDISLGGEGWTPTLIFKYESIDQNGNWLKRKAYFEDDNKLLMEETRTIEYYPSAATPSSQPVVTAVPKQNRSPQFIGGNAAMKQFFAQNANPRKPAIATAGYGEIIVEFTVTETGEIQNAKWKGRVSESLDKEALRLVNMMPEWNPGIMNGVPTKMYVQVGIRFFPQQEFRYIKATY